MTSYFHTQNLALRLDNTQENTLEIISKLLIDEDTTKCIISSEISKITKKAHYHIYAEFYNSLTHKSFTNKLRKLILTNFPALLPYQYCIQKCKDITKYLTYMCKDLDIQYSHGYSDEEINEILITTIKINREKTKKMKTQLTDHIFDIVTDTAPDYREIMKEVIKYHVVRDYLPPTQTLLLQYTVYVMSKLNYDMSELYTAKYNI